MAKRLLDVACSLAAILVSAPVMLVVAVLVRLTSRGPAVFSQTRTGLEGTTFRVYKFRTMVDQAETMGSSVTAINDPRVTSFGRFLRRSKLDELPQFFNVLKGDMSLVGPRPDVPEITSNYTPAMRRVLAVRPGITSVAALHFRDEETILSKVPDPAAFYETVLLPLKVELAMEHVRRNSFWFDLRILLQTAWVLLPVARLRPLAVPEAVKQFRDKYSL